MALLSGCGLTLDLQPPDDASQGGFDAGRYDAGRGDAGADGGPTVECRGPADCDDGDPCNGRESCDVARGACVSGEPPDCDDGDLCTTDSCTATGCVSEPIDCDDGIACTEAQCDPSTGACVQIPRDDLCPSPTVSCISYTCDPEAGCLENDLCAPGDGVCDPAANACTYPDCEASCGPTGPCSLGAHCEGDVCVQELKPAGSACDSDMCRTGVCTTAGACVFAYRDCDDSNPCTADSCDPSSGCLYAPRPDATPCDLDGDLCTLDHCTSGTCTPGAERMCPDDSNPCTDPVCDSATGFCGLAPATGRSCDDGDPCGLDETCRADGSCMATTRLSCPPLSASTCEVRVCDELARDCARMPAPTGTTCALNATCSAGECECAFGFADCDGDGSCECALATGFCGSGSGGTGGSMCRPYYTCACPSGVVCCPCTGECLGGADACTTPRGEPCPAVAVAP